MRDKSKDLILVLVADLVETLDRLERDKTLLNFPAFHLSLIHRVETLVDVIGLECIPYEYRKRAKERIEFQHKFKVIPCFDKLSWMEPNNLADMCEKDDDGKGH